MHICRKWRRIVFAAQVDLHLRLFCTHGTPVRRTLDCWPVTLPIVVEYGGYSSLDPPAPGDENDIMAALKRSYRVISIRLTITISLLEKLSTLKRPFSRLEDLVLQSQSGVQLTLPSAFRWGRNIRLLRLTRIAIPAHFELLYSYRNLTDLKIHEIKDPWDCSLDTLTDALSRMVQLRSLSIDFIHSTKHWTITLPSRKRVIPTLTHLKFNGLTEYLECLVFGIDAPRLEHIEVDFFDITTLNLSKLKDFIDRIEMHNSHRRARILSFEHCISISLTQPGAPACLRLTLFCTEHLSLLTRFCTLFSVFLYDVENLRIDAMQSSNRQGEDYCRQWRAVICHFRRAKWVHVSGNQSTHIVRALQPPEKRYGYRTVLISLHKLYIQQPGPRNDHLREEIVSLMISRRLSGHPIEVEYDDRLGLLCYFSEFEVVGATGTPYAQYYRYSYNSGAVGLSSQQVPVTIEKLSDDVLMIIFRHYLDAIPQFWPALASVCQRWRQIVLTSPLGLNLRLHCTYGTPVSKALDCWPAFPIVVQYEGILNLDPPAPEDDDNIVAALRQSGRVSTIRLTITCSLLRKLSAITEPFFELEEMALMSQDDIPMTLPSTFRCGPRLRTLHSTKIVFPSFPQLLLPCQGLVDLQLHEIPSSGYFSPEEFASVLSEMTHLRTLSLHFLSRRNYLRLPPPPDDRVVLPALTCLKYRGTSRYLGSFVARIDAPRLGDIDITFFSQATMDASQLGQFIERIEVQTSLSQVDIQSFAHAISISFTNSNASTPLRLQISSKKLNRRLSCMAQICHQFSPFLFRINDLGINEIQSSSASGQDEVGGEQWLEIIRSFGGARDFRVANGVMKNLLRALGQDGRERTTLLPALRHLRIGNPMEMNNTLWDALLLFINARSVSGRPVEVTNVSRCPICFTFRKKTELERHMIYIHPFQIMCSYCEYSLTIPGKDHIFWNHLAIKHPQVAHKDPLLSTPLLAYPSALELESLRLRHSSLLRPNTVASSTTGTESHLRSREPDTGEVPGVG